MDPTLDVTVNDNVSAQRFEVLVAGGVAGIAMYSQHDNLRIFTHTIVFPEFEHRGLGGTLAKAALDDARERSFIVRPRCPSIAAFIRENPEYLDLVDPDYQERLVGRVSP